MITTRESAFALTSINFLPCGDSGGSCSVAGRQKERWKEKVLGGGGWWQRNPLATGGLFLTQLTHAIWENNANLYFSVLNLTPSCVKKHKV